MSEPSPADHRVSAMEKSFQDTLLNVMKSAQKPGSEVELHLVGPLLEFFCSSPMHVLMVQAEPSVSESSDSGSGSGPLFRTTRSSGAKADDPEHPEAMESGALGILMDSLEDEQQRNLRHERIKRELSSGSAQQKGVDVLSTTPDGSGQALVLWNAVRRADGAVHLQEAWLVFSKEEPPDSGKLEWFRDNRTSRETLLQHLMALRAQRQLPELTRLVKELLAAEGDRLVDRLARARALLRTLLWEQAFHGSNPGYLRLAEDLGIWVLQSLMGSGWGVRNFGGNAGKSSVEDISEALEEIGQNLGNQQPVVAHRLHCLSRALTALLSPRPEEAEEEGHVGFDLIASAPTEVSAWQQLAAWTWMHEITRAVVQDRGDWLPSDAAAWEALGHQTCRWLATTLSDAARDDHSRFGEGDLADSRNWLRLWFCHQLLGKVLKGPDRRVIGTLRRQLLADLAYVLRESLRLRLFGRRPDYTFQPAAFAAALRTLIEYHSVYELGLSAAHDIARHLYELAEPTRPDQHGFSARHLQHVLEMYIAGQFFCSLEVLDAEGEREPRTLAGVLAARDQPDAVPGPQTISDFRQAFSLAVLFHDVGLVLFPDIAPPNERICREERDLLGALRAVQDTLHGAGRELARRCVEELRKAGWIDIVQDPDLSRWLDDQLASGRPDHALLGAWYLHCTCRNLPDLNPDVVRDAVRAVLLHGVPTRPILLDAEEGQADPVAALLVVCDELFEWLPNQSVVPSPNTVARSRHTLAAEDRPDHSRTRRVRLRDLTVEAHGEQLSAALHIGKKRRTLGWPAVDLVLEPTEFQDVPLLQTWLSMTQNLRRIRRSGAGFGPMITVYTEIPPRLRDLKLHGTRELLERVVRSPYARQLPPAAALEVWLSDDGRFPDPRTLEDPQHRPRDTRLREQCVVIGAEGRAFHTRDIRGSFPQMLEIVDRILADLEGRPRF
ncbi:MAG TPA: hypothetical protein PLA94_03410 [Myxococcota bacterium]|nr:hypothetical protein [Myxococcota bacterium]